MSRFELRNPGFGLVNFFTLKVLFVDIAISVGDVGSDFFQGAMIFSSGGGQNQIFGAITIGINWLPGRTFCLYRIA